jgi:signal transduction histidine kinase
MRLLEGARKRRGTLLVALVALTALALAALVTARLAGGAWALGVGAAGAALLVGTAAVRLRLALRAADRRAEELGLRLRAVEEKVREDRARRHEINATIAGIASAQRLMSEGLPSDRAEALAGMVRAEVDRLQRLVAGRQASRLRRVDLDETISQIVLAHLSRGRVVLWEPTGLHALGRADEIAEVVNILLENAAVHGGPDAVSVRVAEESHGSGVTITVTDQGPGVAPELRDRVFDWGVSDPESPGQGIGLQVAADVARQLGGELELLQTATGASFALHLEAAEEGSTGAPVAHAS